MKFLNKKVAATVLITLFTAVSSFATNYVDSDMSNSAGSNSGKDHLGLYLAICLFLVLTVILAYTDKRSKTNTQA